MNTLTLAEIQTRYIARSQIDTLHLHLDLCVRVLSDYGCEPVVLPNPNESLFPSPDDEPNVINASWPRPGASERANYTMSVVPRMVVVVLEATEQRDAISAADAIGYMLRK